MRSFVMAAPTWWPWAANYYAIPIGLWMLLETSATISLGLDSTKEPVWTESAEIWPAERKSHQLEAKAPMELFVPGRICLFGEHSDWAGGYRRVNPEIKRGYTLICGTEQGIYAEVAPHPDALVLTATTPEDETLGPRQIPMDAEALLDVARRGGFWSYVAGVAYQAMTHYQVGGLVIRNFKTDLPIQKGLSSSESENALRTHLGPKNSLRRRFNWTSLPKTDWIPSSLPLPTAGLRLQPVLSLHRRYISPLTRSARYLMGW